MSAKHYPLALILLLLLWPLAGAAHTHLDRSEPAENATLDSAPATVKLWFSSRIEPDFSRIEVIDAEGKQVEKGKPTISSNRRELETDLNEGLASGTYQVNWNVVARDGHRQRGSFSFSVK